MGDRLQDKVASVVLNSRSDNGYAAAIREELVGDKTMYVRVDIVVNNAGVNVFADLLAMRLSLHETDRHLRGPDRLRIQMPG